MVPGWIAGHYPLNDLAIPLQPLAQAASARLLVDRIDALDPLAREAVTARGETLPYDLISLAAGSEIPTTIEGADRWAVPVRPLEPFVTTWSLLGPRLAEADRPCITVVGAGAGGVEIALAIAYAMRAAGNGTQIHLISGGALLPGHGERARELVRASLVQAQVRLLDSTVVRIDSDHVDLSEGASLPSDLTVLAYGAAAAPWVGASGLQLDDAGFIAVEPHTALGLAQQCVRSRRSRIRRQFAAAAFGCLRGSCRSAARGQPDPAAAGRSAAQRPRGSAARSICSPPDRSARSRRGRRWRGPGNGSGAGRTASTAASSPGSTPRPRKCNPRSRSSAECSRYSPSSSSSCRC